MFDRIMSAVLEALIGSAPVRFLLGRVDPKLRPVWLTFWGAVIAVIVFVTLNRIAARRTRLKALKDDLAAEQRAAEEAAAAAAARALEAGEVPVETFVQPTRSKPPAPPPDPETRKLQRLAILITVVAVILGALGILTCSSPNDDAKSKAAADSAALAAQGSPFRWRSGRMVTGDCVGTFEVTRGDGAQARLVAFAMDTSGAVIARDSLRTTAMTPGAFVEFKFRQVTCDAVDGWQIEVSAPTASSP